MVQLFSLRYGDDVRCWCVSQVYLSVQGPDVRVVVGSFERSCMVKELSYVWGEVVVDEDFVVVSFVFVWFEIGNEESYCWCLSSSELVFDGIVVEGYDHVGSCGRVCLSVVDCSVCLEVFGRKDQVLFMCDGEYDVVQLFVLFVGEVFEY